jgi:hypothetical protein
MQFNSRGSPVADQLRGAALKRSPDFWAERLGKQPVIDFQRDPAVCVKPVLSIKRSDSRIGRKKRSLVANP